MSIYIVLLAVWISLGKALQGKAVRFQMGDCRALALYKPSAGLALSMRVAVESILIFAQARDCKGVHGIFCIYLVPTALLRRARLVRCSAWVHL